LTGFRFAKALARSAFALVVFVAERAVGLIGGRGPVGACGSCYGGTAGVICWLGFASRRRWHDPPSHWSFLWRSGQSAWSEDGVLWGLTVVATAGLREWSV